MLQPPCPMSGDDALFRASNAAIRSKVGNVTRLLFVRINVSEGAKPRSALNEDQDPAGYGGIHRRNRVRCICSIVVVALVFHLARRDAIKRFFRYPLHGPRNGTAEAEIGSE